MARNDALILPISCSAIRALQAALTAGSSETGANLKRRSATAPTSRMCQKAGWVFPSGVDLPGQAAIISESINYRSFPPDFQNSLPRQSYRAGPAMRTTCRAEPPCQTPTDPTAGRGSGLPQYPLRVSSNAPISNDRAVPQFPEGNGHCNDQSAILPHSCQRRGRFDAWERMWEPTSNDVLTN